MPLDAAGGETVSRASRVWYAVIVYVSRDGGATFALVGHSERRHIFGESDDDVRRKVRSALSAALTDTDITVRVATAKLRMGELDRTAALVGEWLRQLS